MTDASQRQDQTARHVHPALAVIAVLLTLAGLRMAAAVAIPLILAMFLVLVFLPLDRRIARAAPGPLEWLGRLVVMALMLLGITLFIGALAYCMQQIATHLPDLTEKLDRLLPGMASTDDVGQAPGIERAFGEPGAMIRQEAGMIGQTVIDEASGLAATIANTMGGVVAGIVLVLFLVLLALGEAGAWHDKRRTLEGAGPGWAPVIATLERTLCRFLVVRMGVGVLTAAIYTVWLLPFGLELLTVWAVLTFLMNFIPNLGSVISGLLPTIYAFLTLDPGSAALLGAGLFVIEQVIGNLVDPRLQGRQIALSPLVILISVVLWGWLWGVAGAFLGTPATLSIMVICNRLPATRPAALLLSNRTAPAELDEVLGFGVADREADPCGASAG